MKTFTGDKGAIASNTFNVSQYVKEHIYMFGGESVTVSFKAKRSIVNQILDWFDGNMGIHQRHI